MKLIELKDEFENDFRFRRRNYNEAPILIAIKNTNINKSDYDELKI